MQELDNIEAEAQKERRIRRIDIALQIFWMISWPLSWWYLRPADRWLFSGPLWTMPIAFFILFMISGSLIYLSRILLDRMFTTERRSSFRSYAVSLVIVYLIITVVGALLAFAASKTADLLF